MSQAERKINQYLYEAHSTEQELVRTLRAQIAMTPHGRHRTGLEAHLRQTEGHARKVRERVRELDGASNPLQWGIGLLESALGQALALGQAPLQLVRGGAGGEEKVLGNAKDACASEAREIATYTALERAANAVGDEQTAQLAASILADEQKMLDRLLREIPNLAQAAIDADVHGKHTYELGETGAADAVREAGRSAARTARRGEATAKRAARRGEAGARRTARRARKVPGVARVEGEVKGAVASEEPWPGYDELSVEEVRSVLAGADGDQRLRARVRSYERSHKDRAGVLGAAEREAAHT